MNTAESGANTTLAPAGGMRTASVHGARSNWRPGLILLGSLLATAVIVIIIMSYLTRGEVAAVRSEAIPAPTDAMPPVTQPGALSSSQWSYSAVKAASGQAERVGCIRSQREVFLEEPYDDAPASLCFTASGAAFLRLDGDGTILSGQGYAAKVEFGDGTAKSFALQMPEDESLRIAYLSPASPLLAAARAGTRMTVSAEFGLGVEQTLTFAPQHPLNLAH